jgi:hypothetical protein
MPDGLWIKDINSPPPEGWCYRVVHGETFVDVQAGNPDLLYGEIIKTCAANGWPCPGRPEVERTLCEKLTIDCRVGRDPFPNRFTKPVPSEADVLKCVHRGERVRKEECPTCGGKIFAIIYRCAIHGECAMFLKPLPGIEDCFACRDCTTQKA